MYEDKCIEKLYELATLCNQSEFQQHAFSILQNLMQFDTGGWGDNARVDDSHIIIRSYLYNQPDELLQDYNQVSHHDILAKQAISQLGHSVAITIEAPTVDLHTSLIHFIEKYDIPHAVTTNHFNPQSQLGHSIILWRNHSNRPFSENERLIKQRITPHLLESFRQCRRFNIQRSILQKWHQNRGLATCDENGILHDADDFFIKLIKNDWPDWVGARLPVEILNLLGKTSLYRSKYNIYRSVWLTDIYLITGFEQKNLQELTNREFEIAARYARNKSYKQIADELSVAPSTIRNHLTRIYEKLAVSNKDNLKQLFE